MSKTVKTASPVVTTTNTEDKMSKSLHKFTKKQLVEFFYAKAEEMRQKDNKINNLEETVRYLKAEIKTANDRAAKAAKSLEKAEKKPAPKAAEKPAKPAKNKKKSAPPVEKPAKKSKKTSKNAKVPTPKAPNCGGSWSNRTQKAKEIRGFALLVMQGREAKHPANLDAEVQEMVKEIRAERKAAKRPTGKTFAQIAANKAESHANQPQTAAAVDPNLIATVTAATIAALSAMQK